MIRWESSPTVRCPRISQPDLRSLRVVVNPNSPTGHWTPPAALEAQALRMADGIVAIDEAYCDFAPASCVPLLPAHPNWLVDPDPLEVPRARRAPGRLRARRPRPSSPTSTRFGTPTRWIAVRSRARWPRIEDRAHHRLIISTVLRERSRLSDRLTGLGWTLRALAGELRLRVATAGTQRGRGRDRGCGMPRILVRRFTIPGLDALLRITVGDARATDRAPRRHLRPGRVNPEWHVESPHDRPRRAASGRLGPRTRRRIQRLSRRARPRAGGMLTDRLIETFESWGYGFMVTPLIEPLDTIAAGVGSAQQSALFRFMDSDGALLALVGERTVSVARVVATQLHDGPFPLRLSYAGSVLRNQAPNAGRRRESLQAGCELIGAGGSQPTRSASRSRPPRSSAAAGNTSRSTSVTPTSSRDCWTPPVRRVSARGGADALARRDLVAVESRWRGPTLPMRSAACCWRFPTLRGGREILDTAAGGLAASGLIARCRSSPSSGICSMRMPSPIACTSTSARSATGTTTRVRRSRCSASTRGSLSDREDGTTRCSRASTPQPATGFVVHADRCHDSVAPAGGRAPRTGGAARELESDAHEGALELARTLRRQGIACVCDLVAGGDGDVRVSARRALGGRTSDTTSRGPSMRRWPPSSPARHERAARCAPGRHAFRHACALLESAGIARLDPARFERELSVQSGDHEVINVRPTDVPVYVEMSACDCGIVGKDVLWESRREATSSPTSASAAAGSCLPLRRTRPLRPAPGRLAAGRDQVPGGGSPFLRRAVAEVWSSASTARWSWHRDRPFRLHARHHRHRSHSGANHLCEVPEHERRPRDLSSTLHRSRRATRRWASIAAALRRAAAARLAAGAA